LGCRRLRLIVDRCRLRPVATTAELLFRVFFFAGLGDHFTTRQPLLRRVLHCFYLLLLLLRLLLLLLL
jgi:hypothetical protein